MNLNQVTIYSDKPVETAEFFQLLGLNIIVNSLPRYARLECPDGESTLSIHEHGSANLSLRNSIVLYFECQNLDAEVDRLKSLGLEFDEEPSDRTWLWREAYLKDPNGNKICLFYAGQNRKYPSWRVK
ncbi:MAG: VOC family protein [Acidobacteria bacterium]|nr:VOC family protein [Acidobacteriota bacterium]